jgi:hypothetical protein
MWYEMGRIRIWWNFWGGGGLRGGLMRIFDIFLLNKN